MIDTHLETWFTGMLAAGIDRSELVLVATAEASPDADTVIEQSLMVEQIACGGALDAERRVDGPTGLPGSVTRQRGGPQLDGSLTALPGDSSGAPQRAQLPIGAARRSVRVLRGVAPGSEPSTCDEFVGSMRPGSELLFGDGLEVRLRHYGVADFEALDAPTALLISDDDDFSAYLRDSDTAWAHGRFANYATHPAAVIANLACLGGGGDGSGPLHRLHIDDDGVARTSPTGRGLGSVEEGLPALYQRWQRSNAASAQPDAVGLDDAVCDDDRATALAERPWISRYVTVIMALRRAQATGRTARRVSGFGGRITGGLPVPEVGDPTHAPILAQFGAIYRAIDPVDGSCVDVDAAQLSALETVLAGAEAAEVRDAAEACQWLLLHGVARRWCAAMRQAPALVGA